MKDISKISKTSGPEPFEGFEAPVSSKKGNLQGREVSVSTSKLPILEELLSSTKENHFHQNTIGSGFTQIQVLNQYDDGTGSGFENCGFHALKNCAIALIPNKSSTELKQLFLNKKPFTEFYEQYCIPFFEKEGIVKGQRDATLPVIESVIQKFLNDPTPPEDLHLLQQALKDGIENQSFAPLMTHIAGNVPVFGFIDTKHAFDGLTLYQFSKLPGPRTLSLMIGDAMLGHWYSVILHKNGGGEISFWGCDSMGSDPLAMSKLSSLLKEKLTHPHQFLKEAYSPLDDSISRKAAYFEPDGTISAENKLTLLEDESLRSTCRDAFSFMKQADWLTSDDYEIQKKIHDLAQLSQFYSSDMPEIANTLAAHDNSQRVNNAIDQALATIEDRKGMVSPFAYKQTKETFEFMKLLYNSRDSYMKIEDNTKRLDMMNTLAKHSGIEQGLISSGTSNEAERSLLIRIDTLIMTFEKAQQEGRIEEFFKVIAEGDGCLTARLGRVSDFQAKLLGIMSFDELLNQEKINSAAVVSLENFLGYKQREEVEVINKSDFHSDMKNFNELVKTFQQYANSENAIPFRQFLVQQHVIDSIDNVEWESALPKIFQMPEFEGWLESGKNSAISWM